MAKRPTIKRTCLICNKEFDADIYKIKEGRAKICSMKCSAKNRTIHGHSMRKGKTKSYNTWVSMKGRCLNKNRASFDDYGGRGITVCERWLEFKNFLEDMGEPMPGQSIDRINNEKGYFKENCRWATNQQQALNKRKKSNTSSIYRGVYWREERKKFMANINPFGKYIFLGYFGLASEAAKAYDNAALKYYGPEAKLNFT